MGDRASPHLASDRIVLTARASPLSLGPHKGYMQTLTVRVLVGVSFDAYHDQGRVEVGGEIAQTRYKL